jgi:hypothetical protein
MRELKQERVDRPVYGSLVLSATTPVTALPIFVDSETIIGRHTESAHKGVYHLLIEGQYAQSVLALPQRNKYTTIRVLADAHADACYLADDLKRQFTDLDSRYDGARLLYKLDRTMDDLAAEWDPVPPYLAIVDNQSEHSYFALLSHSVRTHVIGVFDGVNSSVSLLWTTDPDLIFKIRAKDPTRYVFYRYPDLIDRPMFINTQLVCSRWFSWARTFGSSSDGLLRTFNALETLLYKDPTVFTGS